MTINKDKTPFSKMTRKQQDCIAGASARKEGVEFWNGDNWLLVSWRVVFPHAVYRLPKAAKDQNRPRHAHKLNLQQGDVVRLVKWESGAKGTDDEIIVGSGTYSIFLQCHIEQPNPKGQRPLFIVVSRAADGVAKNDDKA